MTKFHTDQPITGEHDSPDRLGRENFSALVGASLLLEKGSPGIVVSIEGPWGYGKTSVINLIQKYFKSLDEPVKPIVLGFNPWMVSGTDNLTQEFLVQLASEIGRPDRPEETRNAASQLLSYSKVFSVMKYIPGAEPWASIVGNVIEGAGAAADAIGKLKELSMEEKRNRVVEAMGQLDCPLVVFIDDLDRLPPDEVFHMVRMVKAVADFPRVSFVLAFDPEYVQETLEKHGISNSSQYLDKIIQVRLPLPVVERKAIEDLVNEELKALHPDATKDHFQENKHRLAEIYQTSVKHLLDTPRDVRKLFNNLKMREPLIRGEVEFADLFALEALAIKAPGIYAHIRSNPAAYTGNDASDWSIEEPHKKIEKYKEQRQLLIDAININSRRYVIKLLEQIFPLLITDAHGQSTRDFNRKNGRVAAFDRLMVALKFGLPISEVSRNLVQKYLVEDFSRDEILKEVSKEETLERFVDQLELAAEQIDVVNPVDFISSLVSLAEQPLVAEIDQKKSDILSVTLYRQIWWVLKNFFQKVDHAQRYELLRGMMADPLKVGIAALALGKCLSQHGYFKPEEAINAEARWCTNDELDCLRSSWIHTVYGSASRDGIFSLRGAGQIFFLLRKLDPDKTREMVSSMLEKDDDMDALVLAIGESGSDSIKGRYSHIEEQFLETIGNPEQIRNRVQQRVGADTPISNELRAIYTSILGGKKIYFVDNTEGDPF